MPGSLSFKIGLSGCLADMTFFHLLFDQTEGRETKVSRKDEPVIQSGFLKGVQSMSESLAPRRYDGRRSKLISMEPQHRAAWHYERSLGRNHNLSQGLKEYRPILKKRIRPKHSFRHLD